MLRVPRTQGLIHYIDPAFHKPSDHARNHRMTG
jgi:hypothetical protein